MSLHSAPGGAARESTPLRVQIPAISVDSPLIKLGLRTDGTMQVPPAASPAGWYIGAPTPGELGPAILAGHIGWAGHLGVFHRLHELKPGDEVIVAGQDGSGGVPGGAGRGISEEHDPLREPGRPMHVNWRGDW